MNQRGFGGPPPHNNGFGGNIFPFVLGGVVGSLLTNNRRPNYYYPYPMYYYPYPYPYTYYNTYYR